MGHALKVSPSIITPTILSEVIATALSEGGYCAALNSSQFRDATFFAGDRVFRQGDIVSFSSSVLGMNGHGPLSTFEYRIDMLEPVCQGLVVKDKTKLVVVCAPVNDSVTQLLASEPDSEVSEDIDINDEFLGSTLASPLFELVPHPIVELLAKPLTRPVSPEDDDTTVYVRTSNLGRMGALNGDWIVARSPHGSGDRLVRVKALDAADRDSGSVYASPILFHNIIRGLPADAQVEDREQSMGIALQATPFGSSPPVPVAQSVTLARVASPTSMNRIYESLFLNGLQIHFKQCRRLIRKGDLIPVPICTGSAANQTIDYNADNEELMDEEPLSADALVYFIVTDMDYSPTDVPISPKDVYDSCISGGFGCWVDPLVTRMVHTGVERAAIPDVMSYLLPELRTPTLLATLQPDSVLLGPDSVFSRMHAMFSVALTSRASTLDLQLSLFLKGPRGCGKFTVTSWVAQRLGMHLLEMNCYDIVSENDTNTEATMELRFEKAAECAPCILVLRNIEALARTEPGTDLRFVDTLRRCMSSLNTSWTASSYPVAVVATANDPDKVPVDVTSCFKHEISVEAANEEERYEILRVLLKDTTLSPDVSLSHLAVQTAALIASDLDDLVDCAQQVAIERASSKCSECQGCDSVKSGVALTLRDVESALTQVRATYSTSIGAPQIPAVSWEDVGGLAEVKADILDTVQLPLEHPELFADGLKKRSGILLYGPPGTGKTLLAKAVATSCSLNFFSIKGPELLNMYIGESEANVRRVFQRARDAKPCVIFFDELDSIAPKRGSHGDSGGVMDRIVSQLLAELDGMSVGRDAAQVFVIGATNRPDLLDAALLRPGRFDRLLYLGVPSSNAAQVKILEALTRKFKLHPDLSLDWVAGQCPFTYTGADFYALCSDAMLNAMTRRAEAVDTKIDGVGLMLALAELNAEGPKTGHPYPLTPQYYLSVMATYDDLHVLVTGDDFERALQQLIPSVSEADMAHYHDVQKMFSQST
ncbi:AAA-domain-containing protein [Fistulina hepatica ATCC 64428]|nr:AAA-domain-containing protein [Fistulina hepatica ATCC 64428]